jgi:hypothetical protein
MIIKNSSSDTVSWFCYNDNDSVKMIAIRSGNLDPHDSEKYFPPLNSTGFYAVRFTKKGGGLELASGVISTDFRELTNPFRLIISFFFFISKGLLSLIEMRDW